MNLNQPKIKNSLAWLVFSAICLSVFAIPLAPVVSERGVQLPSLAHILQSKQKAYVFFGFQHCGAVCPITLSSLANSYDKHAKPGLPLVVFVDIDTLSDSASAQQFSQSFHPDFMGVHASGEALNRLSQQFGLAIYQERDVKAGDTQGNNDIQHQGRLYLVENSAQQWKIKKSYAPGTFSYHDLLNDIN